MTLRPTSVAALTAIAVSTLLALGVQLWMLGALGSSGSNREPDLALDAGANAQAEISGDTKGLRFAPLRGPAVAQATGLTIPADSAIALILQTKEVTSNLRLTIGWLTTFDIRRPYAATTKLATHAEHQQTVVLLAGHPRWKETITRVAVALENVGTVNVSVAPSALISNTELLPANPIGGVRLLNAAWFASSGSVLRPEESANRLLPMALWLTLICIVSLVAVALMYRKKPEQRAASLRACAIALTITATVLTLLANRWPGWTVPLGAGVAAAIALMLVDRTIKLPLTAMLRAFVAVLLVAIAAWLAPLVAAVSVFPAIMLLLGQLPVQSQQQRWVRAGGLVALVPALLLAAVAQGMIPAPGLLSPLTDPTSTLTTVATSAGGLPGIALGLLAAHQLWPAPALSPRWSNAAVAATVWALTGAIAVLAIPKIALLAGGSSTYIAVFFPALACLALAVFPKFQSVARSVDETLIVEAKSESDLSPQALMLLESHAERVQATLARREMGAAHSALVQMQRIASAAHATALATFRVALADNDLATAATAAKQIEANEVSSEADNDALLELARRNGQQTRVIELAPSASRNEGNLRALAVAHLLANDPTKALQTLSEWPDELTFAREIVELHLLTDDLQNTQKALVNTGIAMTEPSGQAYMARLGMRVQGPEAHADTINSIATWHLQLGTAQAALGELLLRQGNPTGARARFLLAMKLDQAMWPLQYRLQQIDSETAAKTLTGTVVQENVIPPNA